MTGSTGTGVTYSLSTAHITLGAGATGTFTVWMTADKGASTGGHQAKLEVGGTSVVYARAVLYTFVK